MTIDNIIETLALLAVFALVLYTAWPSMLANNVFLKRRVYNYAPSEERLANRELKLKDTLIFAFMVNFFGSGAYVYRAEQINAGLFKTNPYDAQFNPAQFFILGFLCVLGPFVIMLMNEPGFTLLRNLKFAMQVWLTTVVSAPIITVIAYYNTIEKQPGAWPYMLIKLILLGNGLGWITFAALLISVHRYSKKHWFIPKKRLFVFVITEATMLASMLVLAQITNFGWSWIFGWLIYGIIMGVSILLYTMDKTVYTDEAYYQAEVIEDSW